MRKRLLNLCVVLSFGLLSAAALAEEGFESIFNGRDLTGWRVESGSATYSVKDGAIVGLCDPESKTNTFLVFEREFADFILKFDFKAIVPGNSGVQVRSHLHSGEPFNSFYGYQGEIDPSSKNETGRIYDEGRRGFKFGRVWLDDTTPETIAKMQATYKEGDWNSYEVQCVGPSIRTWVNGVPVASILDPCDLSGLIGLQIHAGPEGTIAWRNVCVKELGESKWESFFAGQPGEMKLENARFVLPDEWAFTSEGYLRGLHLAAEQRDGLVISDENYEDLMARVTYRIFGGNSALYFRAEECPKASWVLRGYQNEIAEDSSPVTTGIWHTAGIADDGSTIPGRGWLGKDEELVKKVFRDGDWNTVCTVAIGDHIVNFLNEIKTVDIIDLPNEPATGKLGLQLHGSSDCEMWFKDFDVVRITPEMKALIER